MKHYTRFSLTITSMLLLSSNGICQWAQVGGDASNGIRALQAFNNELFIGGSFLEFGGTTTYYSLSYNGTSFDYHTQILGGGGWLTFGVHNNMLFGGGVPAGSGPQGVGFWNGSSWSGGTYQVNNPINTSALVSFNGDLIVGGSFTTPVMRVGRHDGSTYNAMGSGFDAGVLALEVFNSELYAAGGMTASGTSSINRIGKWTGSTWVDVGGGMDDNISDLEVWNGKLYACGSFEMAGGSAISGVAAWDGSSWTSLGTGIPIGFNEGVITMKATSSGLMVGGKFTSAGGVSVTNIALWDGTSWSDPGALNTNERVMAIEEYQGRVYLGVIDLSTSPTPGRIYKSSSVGIDDYSALPDIQIGPNPVHDLLTVWGIDQGSIRSYIIQSMDGKIIAKELLQGGSIDLFGLRGGTYVIRFNTDVGVRQFRFVKD